MAHYNVQSESLNKASVSLIMPWMVWGLGCLFYFYECLLQVSPSVMSNELMRDFSVTSHTLGILSGIYFYSYAAMQLPGGVLMDYFGPQRLLTLATVVCAVSTIAFGMTDNFFMACVARLMIGFGSAFAAVGTMKLAANWFPAQKFALLTGLMVTIGMMGAIGGETPLALLIDNFGWRESMIIMGSVGLLLATLLILIARDTPKNFSPSIHQHPVEEERLIPSLLTLIKNKQLWLVATYGGLMYMATPVFCGLWGVPFLMNKMLIAKSTAANFISLVFVGWAIASPLWGLFSNRIGLRKPPMYIGCVGAMICSLLFIFAPITSSITMELLLFAFGIFSAGFLPAFSVAKELCNKKYVATGLSFMNMMNMVGIALAQPLIGYILDKMWQGQMMGTVRVYPLEAYYTALSILPIGMLVALLILPKIKETYCQSVN
ncbi:MFS transporter [Legionella pneumophila]|uniref:Lysosomal dipeptide transporter MFSD1 n=1 Tax=Legionella pneumophila subsp. pascullei TaxID=91890 RepID=A0AAX2IWE9_LEGPN|nr:MFS transporter [Legionella pneumophila]AMP90015.1 MFS transporter [Legionella pneumophila subsp. pascullei]AMP92318.1 MFS transporter [Legionella pneumophila subsp. pascullei]AMP95284.1 MFS transporter [Legionella pneumophila subsp. pascullei]SQG90180.1 Sugar phosphate permease [Legionella pneumophila subsp. pascullei]VEH06195.1 Sugar phosphate permease [Legionella pneumophila subsp. pascullei]